jgi:hypothetical protein
MADTNEQSGPASRERKKAERAGPPQRRPSEREELMRDPDFNQADNGRGSQDQTQGSQTGNDVDPVPET